MSSRRWISRLAVGLVAFISGAAGVGIGLAGAGAGDPGGGTATAAAVNPPPVESEYVPIEPCRIVDTRITGGKLTDGEIRLYDARGTDLSSQGGSSSGCGIPARATAIAATLTGVSASEPGFMRVNRTNVCFLGCGDPPPLPNATVLNYTDTFNASNTVQIPICQVDVLLACNKNFQVGNFSGEAHLVIDVVGYYAGPIFAVISGDDPGDPGVAIRRSRGIASVTKAGTGIYDVNFLESVSGCAINVTVGNSDPADGAGAFYATLNDMVNDDTARVRIYDQAGAAVNDDFTLSVAC